MSHTEFKSGRFLSFDDVEMLRAVVRHLRRFHLVAAGQAFWWWAVKEWWRFSPIAVYERYLNGSFDKKFGTETLARVNIADMEVKGDNRDYGVYYQASPIDATRNVLRGLQIPYEQYSFVDFGSGKGRTLLLAAELPFRRVVGVEFGRQVHECAVRNIEKYRPYTRAKVVESIHGDATEFELPEGNLVLYFFNPFDTVVLGKVLKKISTALERTGRTALMVYYYLPDESLVASFDHWCLIRTWRHYRIYSWVGGIA